jgi:hypothetical protein
MLLFKIQILLIAAFASSATERSKGTEETMIGETFAQISGISLDIHWTMCPISIIQSV